MAARNERDADHPDALVILYPSVEISISRKELPLGIIRAARQDRDVMTSLMKAEDKIVDPEIFRPEVLTDEQNFQTFILVCDLRK
jgi:hypothetical protein